MDAGRWLCILLALCIISIFALKAHAATPRTLLDTLDAGSGNVWVNASNPRYLRFSTGTQTPSSPRYPCGLPTPMARLFPP